jgi:hypothetical protein
MRFWTKKTGLVPAVAAFAVVLSGCELEVLNPGAIQDADLVDPALMPILVNGVSAEYNDFQDDLAFDIAILSDEMAGTGSYSSTQEYRQGFFDQEDSEGNWSQTHEAVWAADQAITRLQEVSAETDDFDYPTSEDAVRAWVIKGFANVRLGENFCYAVYGVGPSASRAAAFDSAKAAFDAARALPAATGSDWNTAALAGIAQAEMGRAVYGSGSWATASNAAAAALAAIGADDTWSDDAIYNTTADNNLFWNETWGRAEFGVFRTLAEQMHNADTLDTRVAYKKCGEWNGTVAADPRTMTKAQLDALIVAGVTPTGDCTGEGSGAHQGADGEHAHYKQMVYPERGSNIPRASWDEMILIQAEAELVQNGASAAFVSLINQIRKKYELSEYDAAAVAAAGVGTLDYPHDLTSNEAIDILDRERYASLWMQGRRLYDQERWGHPYLNGGDNAYGPGLGNWVVGGSSFAPRASCMPIARSECLLNENISNDPAVCG